MATSAVNAPPALGPRPPEPTNLGPVINAIYYPSWRVYKQLTPSKLRVNDITHIFYAFIRVNEDGTLRLLDEYADTQIDVDGEKGCLNALAKLKRQHPHLRTVLSIGGGSGSAEFPAMASNIDARMRFAAEARRFVDRYSFDGVDIDWEHPETPQQAAHYIALLQTLRQQLPSPRYLLTTALPVSGHCLGLLSLAQAAQILDLINLMGYDFTGPWTDVAGHHARLLPPPPSDPAHSQSVLRRSCHHGVDYLIQRGVPRAKILLGVPAYVRFFPGCRGPGHANAKDACGEMDYREVPRDWVTRARVDEGAAAAWFMDEGPEGKGFMSFDVPATVREKARYVKAMALRGLFYWTGSGDYDDEDLSLVAAGWKGLREL